MLNITAVGRKIFSLRKSQSMSQEELAEALSVTRQAVSLWENGQIVPSIDNIIELHKVLHVPIETLLCLEEPVNVNPENIFQGYSREFILNLMEEGTFPLPLADVFYQLSPQERMRVLCAYMKRYKTIPHDLYVKLTVAEQQMINKGGYLK